MELQFTYIGRNLLGEQFKSFPRNQTPILAGEQHGVVSLLESLY